MNSNVINRAGLFIGAAAVAIMLSGCASSNTASDSTVPVETISESEFRTALSQASSEYDEFEEETRYEPISSPDFEDSVMVSMSVYVPDSGETFGYLSVLYYAKDWIFFESLQARAGGETYQLMSTSSSEKFTDVDDYAFVTELGLEPITDDLLEGIQAVIDDPDAKLKLTGSGGTIERDFTSQERSALRFMVAVYLGFKQGYSE